MGPFRFSIITYIILPEQKSSTTPNYDTSCFHFAHYDCTTNPRYLRGCH